MLVEGVLHPHFISTCCASLRVFPFVKQLASLPQRAMHAQKLRPKDGVLALYSILKSHAAKWVSWLLFCFFLSFGWKNHGFCREGVKSAMEMIGQTCWRSRSNICRPEMNEIHGKVKKKTLKRANATDLQMGHVKSNRSMGSNTTETSSGHHVSLLVQS